MKEQELTSRMAEVIVNLHGFDDHLDYRYHNFILQTAEECSAIAREFNQLVRSMREYIDKDPARLPPIPEPVKIEYEN